MIRRPPRSTRTHSFPTRRSSDLSSPNQPETQYFSEPLLKVLLAHSARFRVQDSDDREAANAVMIALQQQAQHSLAMRLTNPSSIRSEEHTSELQSLMRISYAVFCLKKKKYHLHIITNMIT